ncbi:MAG: FAD-dependent oxidoreductase, partial [Calditrichota bacterium]
MSNSDVIIIGGGLAGLCCAKKLHDNNISFQILEASDRVGGRVRTDEVGGFLLDRGFQVLLTAYPESRSVLDYKELELKSFYPGSLVRSKGRFIKIADPFRNPLDGLKTLFADIGSIGDKLRIAKLRQQVMNTSLKDIFQRPEVTTEQYLKNFGFSDTIIERFFRPFFGGVYLESELYSSSRMFEFIFRMFSQGDTAIPAGGMEAIPKQLAAGLPMNSIRTNTRVVNISEGSIQLESGESIPAERIVIATDWQPAEKLDKRLPNPGS